MKEIYKAHFESDDTNLRFTMPIAKVDEERRMVSGFATLDNIDRQGDKLLSEASRQAFENFRGNVRLMHQPIPAGKVVSFRENSFYDPKTAKSYSGVFVDAYISKGAENIWQMVLDGTLTGFSIGGRIVDFEPGMDDETEQPIRIVKKYELMELSLVDSPANQFANILSIQKVDNEIVTTGIATGFSVENIFWCKEDEIAITESLEVADCVMCHKSMDIIGWVESEDADKDSEISKAVSSVMQKKMHVQDVEDEEEDVMKETITNETTINRNPEQGLPGKVSETMRRAKKKRMYKVSAGEVSSGDFVAYAVNKDPQPTQYAKGKIESIKRSGSVKVRGTNEMIEATNDNPVAIVRVYRETASGKFVPTDRRVAKKLSNLKKLKPLEKKIEKAESGSTARLRELVTQHNEKYGNVSSKKVTFAMLRQVYNRGIGAYRTNPSSVRPNVASAEQWALARVNGFLSAVRTGRFKRKPFDTDLLPKGHPLASKNKTESMKKFDSNNEGGVEVADNVESPELDTADAEEVEFEVEETVEEIDEEDVDLEKADGVEDQAVNTSEQFDLAKALGEVKDLVEKAIANSIESSNNGMTLISESVSDLAKSLNDKVAEMQSKYEELTKSLADLTKNTEELSVRVNSVEEDTAMKKSGELEYSLPEQPVLRKSMWGGRFLNSAEIF